MTGGTVVVLGSVGRNFGAGMTGGVSFVWDPGGTFNRYVADTSPAMRRPLETEGIELADLLIRYEAETASPVAAAILANWNTQLGRFWVLRASKPISKAEPPALAVGTVQSEVGSTVP